MLLWVEDQYVAGASYKCWVILVCCGKIRGARGPSALWSYWMASEEQRGSFCRLKEEAGAPGNALGRKLQLWCGACRQVFDGLNVRLLATSGPSCRVLGEPLAMQIM